MRVDGTNIGPSRANQTGTARPTGDPDDHVADGDTVDLTNGAKVRLVQIDTPEVYFSPECYGKQASAITKRLLAPGVFWPVRRTSRA